MKLAIRTNTNEVELSSVITKADSDKINKHIVFLHGLFGSSNNWRYLSNFKEIKDKRNSILIDLRNHGESDHHRSMTYAEMAGDVIRHLDKLKVEKFTLLGHSMGAKTAMHVATKFANRLDGLVIVDAAPVCHKNHINIYGNIQGIVDTVYELELKDKNRKQVVEILREKFVNIFPFFLSIILSFNPILNYFYLF